MQVNNEFPESNVNKPIKKFNIQFFDDHLTSLYLNRLEMSNVMAAVSNIGGALCSTPQFG